jgi:hypothetical protein
MSFLTQNMNQFAQAPILGQVDMIESPDVVSAQFLLTSVAVCQVGSAMKLVAGTSGAMVVDVQTGPTDATVFGVVLYNARKNIYAGGDFLELGCSGTYVYLKSGGAIYRGDLVSTTAATTSADPLVNTDTTSGHFETGIAVDAATGANQLVRIKINPSTHA